MSDNAITTQRSAHWLLTINNPSEFDDACIRDARGLGWHVIGQREKGDEGTEHYQIYLKTPQVRFSAVKKVFKRAHIEPAKNKSAALAYVQKEETRIGDLPEYDERVVMTPSILLDKFSVWFLRNAPRRPQDNALDALRFDSYCQTVSLEYFDRFVSELIEDGYRNVEFMAVNPTVRRVVKLYGPSLMMRN